MAVNSQKAHGWLLYSPETGNPLTEPHWNPCDIYQYRREAERVKAPYERIVKVELRRAK